MNAIAYLFIICFFLACVPLCGCLILSSQASAREDFVRATRFEDSANLIAGVAAICAICAFSVMLLRVLTDLVASAA